MVYMSTRLDASTWNGRLKSLIFYGVFFCGPGGLSRYGDSLRTGLSGDRIPLGARFSAPVQTDPGTHSASYKMGSGSYLGVKRLGRGVDHPPPSSAEVKERVELYIYSPSGSSCPVTGALYFYLYLCVMWGIMCQSCTIFGFIWVLVWYHN